MLLAIFVFWAIAVFVYQWFKAGMPLNPFVVLVAIWSTLKAAYFFVVAQSIWVVLWYGLLLLSIDIVTPPYVVDVESLFAFPLAVLVEDWFGISAVWALGLSFAAVFLVAGTIIVLHLFVVRRSGG